MSDVSIAGPDDDPLASIVELISRPIPAWRTAGPERVDRQQSRAGRRNRRLDPGTRQAGTARRIDRRTGRFPPGLSGSRRSADEGPIPERLGEYVILREIGGGGMGVVYEAEHESLKNRVALKVVHPRFRADPKYVRRFHAEARVAAGLHHTNIVSVFDYGDHEGVCYYAMQYIQGQPLDHVLADIRRLRGESTDAQGSCRPRGDPDHSGGDCPGTPVGCARGPLDRPLRRARIASPNRRKRPSRFDPMNIMNCRDPGRSVKIPGRRAPPRQRRRRRDLRRSPP